MNSMTPMFRLLLLALFLLAGHSHAGETQPRPSFVLSSTDGREFTLPDQQNGVSIYFFWASWCPYCRALMPHLQSLKDEFGSELTIYALNFRDEEDPQAYIDRSGFDFIVFPDADEVAGQWGVQGTPGLFILDRNQQVVFNLYELMAESSELPAELNHAQRAQRRAPFWASRIRIALDHLDAQPES